MILILLLNQNAFCRVVCIRFLGRFSCWSRREISHDLSVIWSVVTGVVTIHFCKWYLLPITESHCNLSGWILSTSWEVQLIMQVISHGHISLQDDSVGYYSHFCKWYLFYFWIRMQFARVVLIRFFGSGFSWINAGDFTWTYQSVCRLWQCGYHSHFCKWYLFYFLNPMQFVRVVLIPLGRGSADHAGDFPHGHISLWRDVTVWLPFT